MLADILGKFNYNICTSWNYLRWRASNNKNDPNSDNERNVIEDLFGIMQQTDFSDGYALCYLHTRIFLSYSFIENMRLHERWPNE